MADLYCTATNFGKGFITTKDRYATDPSGHRYGNAWKLLVDNIK